MCVFCKERDQLEPLVATQGKEKVSAELLDRLIDHFVEMYRKHAAVRTAGLNESFVAQRELNYATTYLVRESCIVHIKILVVLASYVRWWVAASEDLPWTHAVGAHLYSSVCPCCAVQASDMWMKEGETSKCWYCPFRPVCEAVGETMGREELMTITPYLRFKPHEERARRTLAEQLQECDLVLLDSHLPSPFKFKGKE